MQRIVSTLLLLVLCAPWVISQSSASKNKKKVSDLARFAGTYDMGGNLIQFAVEKDKLVLIVPGAPLQEMENVSDNRFRSLVFKDQSFHFGEESGKITEVVTEGNNISKGKKIDTHVKVWSTAMDSVLLLKKSTEHFRFLYTDIDSVSIDTLATSMEENYQRILHDLKVPKIATVTVRVYPDLRSFHKGINFPHAPDQVLATAFGKDDIRMVSPNNAGPERWMLVYAAPHEFTHVVHLNISYAPNNPRWLWEGVAQYEAKWFFNPAEFDFIRKKEFPALADLGNGMEYMLGFAVIEAIKDIWGFDTVISLIRTNGDIQKTLGLSQKTFDEKIFHRIHEKYVKE